MGYHRAGWEVVGVDIAPQPHYPFEFRQGDALEPNAALRCYAWSSFDAIHASPPCQGYTIAKNIHPDKTYPMLIEPTRDLLRATGLPYVIENVPGAPLLNHVTVCGLALGLNVKRHRWFESNHLLFGTECPAGHPGDWLLVFGHTVLERGHQIGRTAKNGPIIRRKHVGTDRGREAMGIDWMNRDELSESIPPAYTEFIGAQLLSAVEVAA